MNGNCCSFKTHTHTHTPSLAATNPAQEQRFKARACCSPPPPGRKPSEEHGISLTFRVKPSRVAGQGHSGAAPAAKRFAWDRAELGGDPRGVKARLAAGVFPRDAPHPGAASPHPGPARLQGAADSRGRAALPGQLGDQAGGDPTTPPPPAHPPAIRVPSLPLTAPARQRRVPVPVVVPHPRGSPPSSPHSRKSETYRSRRSGESRLHSA